MSGKIVMIGSMKGGVSKTVTTFNLAYSLSKLGKKVLAVDFDSQANLSTCLGVENVTAVPVTIGNLMLAQIEEEELPERSEYIQTRNGVDYISSSMVLSAVDAKLRLEMGSEKMLSDILETLRDSYDYILIDTSPSLGALTINAMSAADEVLITVNPQLLAMMGLQDFLKTVKKIKNRINSRLWKEVSTCHIEVTYRVNILAVRHSFRTVRCIVRNISLYIQRTELMQQSVAMVPSGSVREGSS